MSEDGSEEVRTAVVLDYLPHGRAGDDRPRYRRSPLAQTLGTDGFGLFELVLESGEGVKIGDQVPIDPPDEGVAAVREIGYDDLSGGARSELEHVVRDLVDADEARFVDFYNEAGPISLRLHQLNLLPGIGDKLRDKVLDARKRGPFNSFEEVENRVSGLHNPKETIIERILEEIRGENVKYRLFAREG